MERVNLILNHNTFIDTIKKLAEIELDRKYCIHDIEHLLNVARIMAIKNLEQNLGFEKEIIYATAVLHDIGRLEQYQNKKNHGVVGSEMAYTILLECGFSLSDSVVIKDAIKTHNTNEDTNSLGQLLRDSDKKSFFLLLLLILLVSVLVLVFYQGMGTSLRFSR